MKTKLILSLSAVAILLASGCGGGAVDPSQPLQLAANPIVGGTTDNGHPAVAVLLNNGGSNPSNGFLCSGTLISPTVFLTAGHCTADDSNAADYQVGGGTDPTNQTGSGGATWIATVTAVHANPQYSGPPNYDHDEGILILGNIQGQAPTPLGWQKTVDDSVYATGTQFTAVGYGITGAGLQDSGIKRTTQLKISDPYMDIFFYGDDSQTPTQVQTQNTCEGDSGGPAISNSTGKVIGTVSFGDQNCKYYGADQRTDYNASFIGTYAPNDGGGGGGPTPTPTPHVTPTPDPNNTPQPKKIFGMDVPKQLSCSVAFGDEAASAFPALVTLALGIALAWRKRA